MLRRALLALIAVAVLARAQAPIAPLVPQLDVFLTETQPFYLSATPEPGMPIQLFWTGELLLAGTDYTVSGNLISIIHAGCCWQVDADGSSHPVVQVSYWKRGESGGSGGSGNMGYAYKRTLTVTSSSTLLPSTQTDFPVLVYISHASLKTAAAAPGTGHIQNTVTAASGPAVTMPADLIFTSDSAGTTKIPWEVESYDGTNGILWAWVKISSCALSTTFYVFYGDAAVVTAQNTGSFTPANVWDSNYKGVWHLADGTTLNATDSTSNALNGTLATPTATTGEVGGGATFNGTTDKITMAAGPNLTGDFTLSVWVNWSNLGGASAIKGMMTKRDSFAGMAWEFFYSNGGSGSANGYAFWYGNSSATKLNFAVTESTSTWRHIVLTRSGNTFTLYRNGASAATTTNAGAIPSSTEKIYLGQLAPNEVTGADYGFQGVMDDARISATARVADWIKAEYNNQSDPTTFVTVGAETSMGSLFRAGILTGIGTGGPFFVNPLN